MHNGIKTYFFVLIILKIVTNNMVTVNKSIVIIMVTTTTWQILFNEVIALLIRLTYDINIFTGCNIYFN